MNGMVAELLKRRASAWLATRVNNQVTRGHACSQVIGVFSITYQMPVAPYIGRLQKTSGHGAGRVVVR